VWDKLNQWADTVHTIIVNAAQSAVDSTGDFFTRLPGRIWDAIVAVWDKIDQWSTVLYQKVSDAARSAVDAGVDFFTKLPGRIWDAIVAVWKKLTEWGTTVQQKMTEAISSAVDSVVKLMEDLPGKMLNAIGDAATKVFDKMEHIGSSLWKGFKKGLFGSPKTKIEYALIDMVDAMGTLTDQAGVEMGRLQNMAVSTFKKIPVGQFDVSASGTLSGASGGPVGPLGGGAGAFMMEAGAVQVIIQGNPDEKTAQVAGDIVAMKIRELYNQGRQR
jgi:hypothetical protein